MRSFLFLLTWMEFFPPSGRSCTCEILLGLEELLTYSPCCQLVRLEVLVKVLPYSVRVIECYSVLWFLHVLPQKNCVLVTGCSSPFFLTYWYADLLRVREKNFFFFWALTGCLCTLCSLWTVGVFSSTILFWHGMPHHYRNSLHTAVIQSQWIISL